MDQDPVPGEAERARNSAKEAIGKLTGDAKDRAEHPAAKAGGKAENEAAAIKGNTQGTTRNQN